MASAFDSFVAANFPNADRHLRGALRRAWDKAAGGAADDELADKILEMETATNEAAAALSEANNTLALQEAKIQELEGEIAELQAASGADDTDNDPVSHEG